MGVRTERLRRVRDHMRFQARDRYRRARSNCSWQYLILGIIAVIFILIVVVGFFQLLLFYLSYPVFSTIRMRNEKNVKAPSVMMCPDPKLIPSASMNVIGGNLSTDAQILAAASNQPGADYQCLMEVTQWSADKRAAVDNELRAARAAFGGSLPYAGVPSVKCTNAFGDDLGCASVTSLTPTVYGLCAFIDLRAIDASFRAPGTPGRIQITMTLPSGAQASTATVYMMNAWQYTPPVSGIKMLSQSSEMAIKFEERKPLGAPYNKLPDAADFAFMSPNAAASQEEFMTSKHGRKPIDCWSKCSVLQVFYECGCFVPYASNVLEPWSLNQLAGTADWSSVICSAGASTTCVPKALEAFSTSTQADMCTDCCKANNEEAPGSGFRYTPQITASAPISAPSNTINIGLYAESSEVSLYKEMPAFTFNMFCGAIVITILMWLMIYWLIWYCCGMCWACYYRYKDPNYGSSHHSTHHVHRVAYPAAAAGGPVRPEAPVQAAAVTSVSSVVSN